MSDHHVCPWWLAYTFDNPLRRIFHDPQDIFSGYVDEGMTVIDLGCGMGYFTLGLAEIVGPVGRVIAVDLQQQMLDVMMKRAIKKGVADRITPYRTGETVIGVEEAVDFALAFWMVHEVPDPAGFFKQVGAILKPSAKLLYTEPAFHVPEQKYNSIIQTAAANGLVKIADLSIRFSRGSILAHSESR